MTISCEFSLKRKHFNLAMNLDMPASGITAVTGESGGGKTSFLRVLTGLEFCPGAIVKVGDSVWQNDSYFMPVHKRAIGYVFQKPTLFSHLSVQGNINYAYKRALSKQQNLEELIDLLAIRPLLHRRADQLSGGEQQRVAIVRALAISPQLLLMDEPLATLDLQKRHELLPFLESLRDHLRIPLIYVSHEPEELIRLADYMIVINDGKVEAAGDIAQVLTTTKVYLTQNYKAAALVQAQVISQDKEYGLTILSFDGGRLSLVDQHLTIGQKIRLMVAARDVSLTLKRQSGSSIMNTIETIIDRLTLKDNKLLVRLLAGETPLLALISRKAGDSMKLHPGKKVYAQIKTIALIR